MYLHTETKQIRMHNIISITRTLILISDSIREIYEEILIER